MNAQIVKTPFTCELITIRSKRSFAELISRIENTFQHYDAKTLRDLTVEGDTEKLAAYVKQVGEPTEFAIFFSLDQGSTQRLAEIPIESRFYLFGNATIARVSSDIPPAPALERPCASASHRKTVKTRRSTSIFQLRSLVSFPKSRIPRFRRSWTTE